MTAILVHLKEEEGSEVLKGTYAKDEFFDTMSCEALEKLGGSNQEGRRSFAEQRKVDQETFGGLASNMNRRGRWGSRNMRGRGRGRGRVRLANIKGQNILLVLTAMETTDQVLNMAWC